MEDFSHSRESFDTVSIESLAMIVKEASSSPHKCESKTKMDIFVMYRDIIYSPVSTHCQAYALETKTRYW